MEADEVEELQVQLQECLIQIIFNFSNWRLNFALLFSAYFRFWVSMAHNLLGVKYLSEYLLLQDSALSLSVSISIHICIHIYKKK